MSSSPIVVKVQYGTTLKRFKVAIQNDKLALDNFTLREKIRGLFSIASGDDFTLTYMDEDHHEVTLSANGSDELDDILQQRLNPLFMTVKLTNSINAGISSNLLNLQLPYMKNSVPTPKRSPYSRPLYLLADSTAILALQQRARSQSVKTVKPAVSQTSNAPVRQSTLLSTLGAIQTPNTPGLQYDPLSTVGGVQTVNSSSALHFQSQSVASSSVLKTQNTQSLQQQAYQTKSNNETATAAGVSELVRKMKTDVMIKSED